MNRKELVEKLHQKHGGSLREIRRRKGRLGVNPRTKERMPIGGKRTAHFRSSNLVRSRLNPEEAAE